MPDTSGDTLKTLAISVDTERVIGAIVDSDGRLSAVNALPNPVTESRDEILHTIVSIAKQVLIDLEDDEIVGAGLVISEPVSPKQGLILQAEQMPQLSHVDLSSLVENELGHPVSLENDINAMALLEAYTETCRDTNSIFYIFVDNEINGAIVQNGEIWHGMHSNAGQISHLVADWMGTRVITLGQRASGQGIATEYNIRSRKHRTPTIDEIIQYARQGDHLAIRVIRDGAVILGSVLSPVINLIDPAMVVVGGRFAHTNDLWWSNFVSAFNDARHPQSGRAPVVRSHYDEDAPLQAAALIARIKAHSLS